MMEVLVRIDGSGRVSLAIAVPVLRAEEQVLAMMLDGWRQQQLSRGLQFATIDARLKVANRFIAHANVDPWEWSPAHVEEFFGDLRSNSESRSGRSRPNQSGSEQRANGD